MKPSGAVLLAVALLAGCGDDLTELVVVVRSDLTVPTELDTVALRVDGPTETAIDGEMRIETAAALPITLSLTPGGDALGPITVTAIGRGPTGLEVTRQAQTRFVDGEQRLLILDLRRACAGMTCTPGSTTCSADTSAPSCVDVAVPPGDLPALSTGVPPNITENTPGDAGMDAGIPIDANVGTDAGPGLLTCPTGVCAGGETHCTWGLCHDEPWAEHAIGRGFMCSMFTNPGPVHCVGANDERQLGDGTTNDSTVYRPVLGVPPAVAIAAGPRHACAIDVSGEVWCWGRGRAGRLGHGFIADSSDPSRVVLTDDTPLTGALQISLGDAFSCAATSAGLYCWGDNADDQLGDGASEPEHRSAVRTLTGFAGGSIVDLSLGGAFGCIVADGSVACWGADDRGQLGSGTMDESRATAVAIPGLGSPERVIAGKEHACALTPSGTLFEARCWGDNRSGQIARPASSAIRPPSPIEVPAGPRLLMADLVTGARFSCGVSLETFCWGDNDGQLFLNGDAGVATIDEAIPSILPTGLNTWAGQSAWCTFKSSQSATCRGSDAPPPL